ncbi:MarR family winged helix-turn-helix transcriptional regulator [Asticcacaulis sp. AND118]|uniref:MarR family winged helix-turn-helix transcriptional regulator n=1 Tax=Asticcacaulis sp. AND118 TaxID=2840468 RepID=UPI001CFF9DFC|nr:MarR family transcriptional regulator [Asticcacaulis sp. AND118]UDF03194.1 MarR family transcriptional regulator [Asticcacaulis sp. AND118]
MTADETPSQVLATTDKMPWDLPRFRNWIAVARAHQMVEKTLNARLAPHGVRIAHHDILANIYRFAGLTQNELALRLLVGRSNLSMLLPELEKRGLIERRSDEADRRVRRLWLTDSGRELTEKTLAVQAGVVTDMMTILSDAECQALGDYMRRISTGMAQWAQEAD